MGLKSSPLQQHSKIKVVSQRKRKVPKILFLEENPGYLCSHERGSGVVLGRGQDVAIPALRATCHLEEIVEVVEIY